LLSIDVMLFHVTNKSIWRDKNVKIYRNQQASYEFARNFGQLFVMSKVQSWLMIFGKTWNQKLMLLMTL